MKHLVLACLVACGGGSGGGDPACITADSCPLGDPCEVATCTDGICGLDFAPAGEAPQQIADDCRTAICDGAGNLTEEDDDSDRPLGTECEIAGCQLGEVVFAPTDPRTECETTNVCDGAGSCVECIDGGDCFSGSCATASCEAVDCSASAQTHLLISEMRARGSGGSTDDFVELYNPTDSAITLTAATALEFRSDTAQLYSTHFTGAGQVVAAHGHFLIIGAGYNDAVASDGNLLASFADQGSLVLKQNGIAIDALCFVESATLDGTYVCDGTPITRVDITVPQDVSVHRKPNGALGNCVDHTDTVFDWTISASDPQNTTSAVTP